MHGRTPKYQTGIDINKFTHVHAKNSETYYLFLCIDEPLIPPLVHMKSLVPKRYKSIFVYSRKMQSKFGIYWEMH
jgi:hypothetical protein